MAGRHTSDDTADDGGVSRFPFLFALVAIIFVSTIVSLVLVHHDTKSGGSRAVSDNSVRDNTVSSTPTTATTTPTSSAPTTSAPTTSVPTTSAPAARTTTAPTTVAPQPAPSVAPAASRTATYVVKQGDNLFVIAQWFKLHGYGDLYARNKAVIGADPNLIRPGQRITVSSTGMMTSR